MVYLPYALLLSVSEVSLVQLYLNLKGLIL